MSTPALVLEKIRRQFRHTACVQLCFFDLQWGHSFDPRLAFIYIRVAAGNKMEPDIMPRSTVLMSAVRVSPANPSPNPAPPAAAVQTPSVSGVFRSSHSLLTKLDTSVPPESAKSRPVNSSLKPFSPPILVAKSVPAKPAPRATRSASIDRPCLVASVSVSPGRRGHVARPLRLQLSISSLLG